MAAADGGSKKAAAAASDGSVAAAGRRRELRSSSGSAGVLSGRGAAGARSPLQRLGRGFCSAALRARRPERTTRVPAAAHLPAAERGEGCRVHPIVQTLARSSESAGPPSPRSRSPPPLAPPSLPGEAAEAAGSAEGAGRRRAAGTAAAEAGAAPGAGRRGVRRGTPPGRADGRLSLGKVPALGGGPARGPRSRGGRGGCACPGARSCFSHLCHQVSAAGLRRLRQARAERGWRARARPPFSCLPDSL